MIISNILHKIMLSVAFDDPLSSAKSMEFRFELADAVMSVHLRMCYV